MPLEPSYHWRLFGFPINTRKSTRSQPVALFPVETGRPHTLKELGRENTLRPASPSEYHPELMVVGCTAPAAQGEAAALAVAEQEKLDAIKALVDDWVEAYDAGVAKALTALFAEDAMRLPPDEKAFSGHTRIESEFDAEFEGDAGETTIRLEERSLRTSWSSLE